LKKHLESFGSKVDLQTQPLRSKPKGKKAAGTLPNLICGWELYRITGIDWAQGNGVDGVTAQTVVAECGADLSAFPSEKQFTSRLGLVPTNDQSSGKILKRRTRKVVNRAATAFRNAATTLVRSQSAQYRRLRTRLGGPRPSPPWLANSPAYSTGLSNTASSMPTKGWNTMRHAIANSKSDLCESGRKSSVFY